MKKLIVLLMIMMMTLSGCNKVQEDTNQDDSETTDAVQSETEVESEEEEVEYEYREVIHDRSQTEGKMAVYYIAPTVPFNTWTGSTHAGDSILYVTPDGKTLLYDCNIAINSAYLVHLLQELGIEKIDYFVNSHPHSDHIGGYKVLLRYIDIGHVYTPPAEPQYFTGTSGDPAARGIMPDLDELGIPHSYLQAGDSFQLGEYVTVKIYNPPTNYDYTDSAINGNEMSIVMRVIYKDSSFMNIGDLGNNKEELGRASMDEILAEYGDEMQTDVATMGHHGNSRLQRATDSNWLSTVNAKIWIGSMSTIEDDVEYFKYVATGALALHNGIDGTVVVTTPGDGTYDVQVEYERFTTYYGELDTEDGRLHVE